MSAEQPEGDHSKGEKEAKPLSESPSSSPEFCSTKSPEGYEYPRWLYPSPDQIPLGAQCRTTLGHANLLKPDSVRMKDEGELLNEYLLVRKVIAAWVAYEQKVLKALVKRRMI